MMHVNVDVGTQNVLIIGCPASGKTYLSELLLKDNPGHKLYHSDKYIRHGYKEALYKLLEDLVKETKPTIVEGVQGYRLLRKGVELDCYYPDIVIELEITEARMFKTYAEQRRNKDASYLKGFNKMHQKILADYFAMENKHKPNQWLKLKNHY
jgi:hypothetical protein